MSYSILFRLYDKVVDWGVKGGTSGSCSGVCRRMYGICVYQEACVECMRVRVCVAGVQRDVNRWCV